MIDSELINEFERTWRYVCGMRDAFISCVPEDHWHFTHHSKFAPLVKQFKHVIKVYGCYVDAMESKSLDMSKKASMYEGAETRENILKLLHQHDNRLRSILATLRNSDLSNFKVNVFGMTMGFSEYTHVMIHHDVSHFGIWANYAAFGGFDTPEAWRQDWKL